MKIFEHKPIIGTFTNGMENYNPDTEVVELTGLEPELTTTYNTQHKQEYHNTPQTLHDHTPTEDYDLAILQPEMGRDIQVWTGTNLKTQELKESVQFIEKTHPEYAIIITTVKALPTLNRNPQPIRDGFGVPSHDLVIAKLQKLNYQAYFLQLEGQSYGVPNKRKFSFYIATPPEAEFKWFKPLYTPNGENNTRKLLTTWDCISDLGESGMRTEYETPPANEYQANMRNENGYVTWHKKNMNRHYRSKIKPLKQGESLKDPGKSSQRRLLRAIADKPPRIDGDFAKSNSRAECVHPIEDRFFTIREGCRMLGIPDRFDFPPTINMRTLQTSLFYSVPPVLGELMMMALDDADKSVH